MIFRNNLVVLAALVLVISAPLVLRPKQDSGGVADRTLVIITPHNESIRQEFGEAFAKHYLEETGQRIRIDWRTPGGTNEIARYLASQYLGAFQNYWIKTLGKPWGAKVRAQFDNPAAGPDREARKAFLESNVGCGIDLLFGGGSYDSMRQAAAGRLVDCGIIRAHPEIFNDRCIPQTRGGEVFWDAQGRWVGTCLSAFGICFNTDALKRLNIEKPPDAWNDLGDPRYFGQVAAANPTQSGSVAKAFEMITQQQIQMLKSLPEEEAVREGWARGLRLIRKIGANARYFTDSATKIPWDVDSGDAAIGMCIDFYGRFQSEAVRKPDGSSRLQFIIPPGGSSVGADPIGVLRGAPHPQLAREFIEFVLSLEGQKLWNWKAGTPRGPAKYALRRLPIRPELYAPQYATHRSDPDVDPFKSEFVYHEEWTAPVFRSIGFIVRVMCIDTHDELRAAWRALIDSRFPPEATALFDDVSVVSYQAACGSMRDTLVSAQKVEEVRLAKTLGDAFRAQYRRVQELAQAGR